MPGTVYQVNNMTHGPLVISKNQQRKVVTMAACVLGANVCGFCQLTKKNPCSDVVSIIRIYHCNALKIRFLKIVQFHD